MGIHHHDLPRAAASAHASALAELRALRKTISDRIEADIALLDALDGDPNFEADHASVEADASGRLYYLGRTADDEDTHDAEAFTDDNGLGDRAGYEEQYAHSVLSLAVYA